MTDDYGQSPVHNVVSKLGGMGQFLVDSMVAEPTGPTAEISWAKGGYANDRGEFITPAVSTMFSVPMWYLVPDIYVMLGKDGPYRVIDDRGTSFVGDVVNLDVTIAKNGIETAVYGVYKSTDIKTENGRGEFRLTYYLEKIL